MSHSILLSDYANPLLNSVIQRLAMVGIELKINQKRVKNINFRLKPYLLTVSVPVTASTMQVAKSIDNRVGWALAHHAQVVAQHNRKQLQSSQPKQLLLWGKAQNFTLTENKKNAYYREQLTLVMPELFSKWQPIVGAQANETRIKKMHTRWGSCNTRARRIWLSVYLPAYPIQCTEYVIVHELCHLHHPNHSSAFWQSVTTAMPEYKRWHEMLAGKSGQSGQVD